MITLTSNTFMPLGKDELKALTKLVPETAATAAIAGIGTTFTHADLWKIHRAKKSVRNRRCI